MIFCIEGIISKVFYCRQAAVTYKGGSDLLRALHADPLNQFVLITWSLALHGEQHYGQLSTGRMVSIKV